MIGVQQIIHHCFGSSEQREGHQERVQEIKTKVADINQSLKQAGQITIVNLC